MTLTTPQGIDDHEKPRYTTRRLRYEIDRAVEAARCEERERCASKARLWATDVRNSHEARLVAGKILAAIEAA